MFLAVCVSNDFNTKRIADVLDANPDIPETFKWAPSGPIRKSSSTLILEIVPSPFEKMPIGIGAPLKM